MAHRLLVDYENLRSGEVWSEALKQLIDKTDIFHLFWSRNSALSEYVKQEWQYALDRSQGSSDIPGAGFIRPVYSEQPMPDAPHEISHLHFKSLLSLANAGSD